ncbi:MAG: NlpC/P60 family protein [Rhizobiaceae bacterium]|nr:NlpC/P60 family protein [Rhizobiaceae bacterium]
MSLTSEYIVGIARQWLNTPYVHQASQKNVGCDCLGLVRGIWREIVGDEPQSTPNYSPDWGEVGGEEILAGVVGRYFQKSKSNIPQPGNLLLFRWRETSVVKHLGIMAPDNRFIHAYEKAGVVESSLVHDWQKRIAGIYIFPGIID